MIRYVLITILGFMNSIITAHANEPTHVMVIGGPGCLDKAFAEELVLARSGYGQRSYLSLSSEGMLLGICHPIPPQTKLFLEDYEFFGLSCVRPINDNRCYWVSQTVIERM